MKQVIFVDFQPKKQSQKEHSSQYVTERIKVAVLGNEVRISQFLGEESVISLTKEDIQTIKNMLPDISFPKPEVIKSEIRKPVQQDVIQADFVKKTFKMAVEVETVETLRETMGVRTVISGGRIVLITYTNLQGHDCILIRDGFDGCAFYKETLLKVIAEAERQEQTMECKVLEFPAKKDTKQAA